MRFDAMVNRSFGHGYFDRMPGLRQVHHAFNALAAGIGWRFTTTYAGIVARNDTG